MFKKIGILIFIGCMLCMLSACNSSENTKLDQKETEKVAEKQDNSTENTKDEKSLVVYFSYSGNTEKIANIIADNTNSDIFEIVPVKAYPEDYNECVDLASEEKAENARPEIQGKVENIDTYDTIYLGYPCWWGTSPMCVFTFLDSYDLTGKTIIPFTTHGGSGFGTSIEDIKSNSHGATILEDGLAIQDSSIDSSETVVIDWLKKLK